MADDDDLTEEPALDPLQSLYVKLIGRLGQVAIDLTVEVEGLRTLLIAAGVVTEDQLRTHMAAYRAAHQREVRERFMELMGEPDEDDDSDDEEDDEDER
jgi:hypothetical protein